MNWIDKLSVDLAARYGIDAVIKENLLLKFGKWQHRLTLDLSTDDSRGDSHIHCGRWRGTYRSQLQANQLAELYNDSVNAHWRAGSYAQMFIYTNDLEELLAVLNSDHRSRIIVIDYMQPETAATYVIGPVSQYKTSLTVKRLLPYGRYRYKIHAVTNTKIRNSIGKKSLAAVVSQLDNYETFLPSSFRDRAELLNTYSSNYFYAMDLNWLMIISLIDPRYIKHIEEIKTPEEIENEQLNSNTTGTQPNP